MKLKDDREGARDRARGLRQRMTPWEANLWKKLRGNRFNLHWRRQHPFEGYILDFYCDVAKVCVEIDGAWHDPNRDSIRDGRLLESGIVTLRFSNVQMGADMYGCLEEIQRVCEQRMPKSSSPKPEDSA